MMKFVSGVTLSIALAAVGWGQDFRATIMGQVTDQSKSVVPNANVKAVNVANNGSTEVKTNAQGYYTIPYLNPGTYNIEASAAGFNTLKREGIVLQVADRLNLPLALEVGQVTQSVTVTGEQELIQTTTANRGLVFDPIKMQEYPLNGRQSYMLMALTPGVIFTQEQFGANGFSGTRGWDMNGSYRINGGRSGTNQFLLNGAPISTTGSWQVALNVEAIQEFKVMTSTYDAQYGRTGGGHVNTTMKSGTNDWHGTGFDFFRNSVLDANTYQNNLQGAPRGKHNQHQFGGTIGVPIRKDKDFLFFSDESWREVVPFPLVTSAPPADLRDGGGWDKYTIKLFDPLTTRDCASSDNCISGGTRVRQAFPGNMIPRSRISPIGTAILKLYPMPNGNPGARQQNFFATGAVGRYRYDQPSARWDHVFGERDRLYAMFYFQQGKEYRNNNGFDPPAQRGNIWSHRRPQGYIADYTRMISPAKVLDVRLSFTRFTSFFPDGEDDYSFTYDKLGIKRMPPVPTVGDRRTAPTFTMDDYPQVIGNSYSWSTDNHWDFMPSVTHTKGTHTLHYGLELARRLYGSGNPGQANGQLGFGRSTTQQYTGRNLGSTDGSGIASLLLGVPNGGGIDFNDTYFRRGSYIAGYLQDDWKVNRKLTLNLGLRYDFEAPFTEIHDRVNAGFDFTAKNPLSDEIIANWKKLKVEWDAANPPGSSPAAAWRYPDAPSAILGGKVFAGVKGQPRRTYYTDWQDIQPRLGFAYNMASKMVLRGGFGIFHKTATQGNYTDGFNLRSNYVTSLDGILPSAGLTGPYSLEDPFPDGASRPPGSSLGLLTNVGRGISYDGRQRLLPRTYEYSFTVERELPWGTVLEATYSGMKTVHDTAGIQQDNVSWENVLLAQQNPLYLDRQVPNPFYGIVPITADFRNPTISTYNLNRPFPLFNGISQSTNPWGWYRYDSLQIRLEKRAFGSRDAGVLTFVLAYTFSKSFEANHRLNDWNVREPLIHELDYQDKPQSFALSGVWDLPLGKSRRFNSSNRAASWLMSGWNLDWIVTYYSGYPVGKPDAQFFCSDYRVAGQTHDRWLNNDRNCYAQRLPYTLRTVEDRFPNIRNPAEPQVNVALAKNFRITERISGLIRGESFNIANTIIYPGPETNWQNPRFGMLPLQQNNFPRLVQLAAKIMF
jgi:hypothetical protein